MNSQEPRDPEGRFEEAFREWLNRPPSLSPADAAARIGSRLPDRRWSPKTWMFAAAASLLAAAVGISIWWSSAVVTPAPIANPAILGAGEVLIWLDDQTPLYMTFQAADLNPDGGEK